MRAASWAQVAVLLAAMQMQVTHGGTIDSYFILIKFKIPIKYVVSLKISNKKKKSCPTGSQVFQSSRNLLQRSMKHEVLPYDALLE